ncbi:hypothetical protein [Deinococcus roseus]|uniref:Uncharacterized protein n=1 Tax=Deinococcus roseus TaxID=392414 RepID=A0ABQ2D8E8_9DEIO|nr:hypothetical protein [Deinococcus roseus]GGJ47537.1 hypothetical protein GCM10008938_36920 [Deinococcus roseus]
MNAEDLLQQEARRLTRDALLLTTTETPSGIVGHWGGEFVQAGPFKHHQTAEPVFVLTAQAVPVPSQGLTVYRHQNREGTGGFSVLPKAHRVKGAEPLYAQLKESVPPLQAICLYGSTEVERWLRGLGLSRMDDWQLPADLEDTYNTLVGYEPWPWWSGPDVALVMNPWPMMWPDDEVYPIAPAGLVAATLRDAEPYLQVWWSEASMGWWLDLKTT